MPIRHLLTLSLAAALAAGCQSEGANNASAGTGDSATGGAKAPAARTIAETAAQSADLSQLNAAVQSAGLAEVLRAGSYTVFAPTNAAFDKLPQETRARLLAPEGRDQLRGLISYHIVPGVVTTDDLVRAMVQGGGRATLASVGGGNLIFSREGEAMFVSDTAGGRARISQPNQIQSNGVIHHLDTLLMPGAAQTPE
ncbi:fasciclin domain-containing protein [Allosphingosinicella sp.]|jgi:uncharacterized surface protein with fasciclin (FAS1) repeats|uniref:fasciclin domain-containing protein n=1 Tax=Allosphingosinicella sp. TaxID=2823234 RepID=UPI002F20736E